MNLQKVVRWTARISGAAISLGILSDFVLYFFGFENMMPTLSRSEQLHTVLLFEAALSLLIAWRYEKVGGIFAVVIGVALGVAYWFSNEWQLLWPAGAVIATLGLLFILASRPAHKH